ncbi:MAG: PAS domain S-box protein [Alphaproteobacteria bacterium]|nr:PAS domain S-box protein [Alphaproteobacteria bacterium]
MPSASYSFLDVAALDGVRERFASGDALAILSSDLDEVIWANGPGAALLGYADIEDGIGAASRLGMATRRQIAATRGFPKIGRDRPVQLRMTTGMTSRMVSFLASSLVLPDGEAAILLAAPAPTGGARSERDIAERAIGGFAEVGHFAAFLDADGNVEAASAGFDALGLGHDTLADLVRQAAREADRIVKQMIPGASGSLPAGLARLTERRNLLVVIDEGVSGPDTSEPAMAPQAETPAPSTTAGEAPAEAKLSGSETPSHDSWYFSEAGKRQPPGAERPDSAGMPTEEPTEIAPTGEAGTPTADPASSDLPLNSEPANTVEPENDIATVPPSPSTARPSSATGPVRFVWRTDAEGKFSQISPEFADAVGEEAADIVGRSFDEVARALGLDPKGDIAGLLARRDTWSGRSVMWPVSGTDLQVPVDLAALPVYDRNRAFEGFRGFGVARTGDATVDPRATGLALTMTPAEDVAAASGAAQEEIETEPQEDVAASDPASDKPSEPPADPFRGEVPALSIVPAQDRRFTDKVIRLAERRPTADNDKGLSSGERLAFQQIGERLKKDGASTRGSPPATEDSPAETDETTQAVQAPGAPVEAETPDAPEVPDIAAVDPEAEPTGDTEADTNDLRRLDGADEAVPSADDEGEPLSAGAPAAGEDATDSSPARETTPEEPAAEKPGRPGMSLLDFAQWDAQQAPDTEASGQSAEAPDEPSAEIQADQSSETKDEAPRAEKDDEPASRRAPGWRKFTLVEMEEAAGLDVSTPEPARTEGPSADAEQPSAKEDPSGPAIEGAPDEPADRHGKAAAAALADVAPKSAAGLSILEKLPVPVLVHSGDTLHYANDEFAALTGYGSVEELADAGGIGVLFADSYEDEDAPEKVDRQLRLKTRDGEEIPVEAFLQSVPWNGGKALLLVLSRSKEGGFAAGQSPLIAELEARVAEMRTIIDTATDGVVLISPDGTIRSISRPAEALFGFESDEVVGKHFASLFAIESQRAARDYLAGLSDNGVASVLNDGREVIGREAEGRFIPLFMTIGKLPGESGYCAVVRDITQWKRAEEDLTQARALAERASSQKTDFLARVSHEIRTPLNAIIGFSELMMDEKFGPVANDRYRDYLRDINRSGNHVLDLVNDLLDISKIEAGQQEMAYEAVSLNDTLSETVAMMQPQANRERVIIRSSFASSLPDVVADLRSVRQIALNILSNAVRYTQAGGQVIVSTAYEAAGEVVMRVRDTGIGMSSSEIEQALKPFKQINSLKRARGDGTGLGLPLTKAMVEANRAKFTINSTPGEGTLVEISFPPTRVLAD